MLNLSHNMLEQLPSSLFPNTTFGRLQWLDLSHNRLLQLPSNIFKNLPSMGDLSLARNRLCALPDDVFLFTPLEVCLALFFMFT
jgi:Leucine-rich repeat (LRR) protein